MKLIVLYGEENSGKTITLRMVYERLKEENLLETNCFKHYDNCCRHDDYRDVLVLSEVEGKAALPTDIVEYDGKKSDDIVKAFPDGDELNDMDIDESLLDDDDIEPTEKLMFEAKEEETIIDENEEIDSELENEKNVPEDISNPDLHDIITRTAELNPKKLRKIGIILEGDYGFIHELTGSISTKHKRNLYKNLKKLSFCDVIICACSKLREKKTNKLITDPMKKPINCVKKYIKDYAPTFYVINSIQRKNEGWDKKTRGNKAIADQIIELVGLSKQKPFKGKIFGQTIQPIGNEVKSLQDYLDVIKLIEKELPEKHSLFYRGESQDYGATAIHPQLFRKNEWIEHEHDMINDFVAKFPDKFPKGTTTFDIMVNADHFSLPVRLLDISHSAFTGLFMACYNFRKITKVDDHKDGYVYIFSVPKCQVKNWNSDAVTLLSNLARMDYNFPDDKKTMKDNYSTMLHTIKDERPDYYNVFEGKEEEYKNAFNKIICVESKMLNARISNQKGLFFLFGINGKKQNFEKMEFESEVRIYSIKIDGKSKKDILKQLEVCGYDKMTMFPDMQNVCENIKENY